MYTRQGIYGPSGLEKINSIAYLEVKLLAENPCQEWMIEYFPIVEDHLIQKRGNSQSETPLLISCGKVSSLWTKNGGVLGPKAALEYHKLSTCMKDIISCYWSNSQSELGIWLGGNHVAFQ